MALDPSIFFQQKQADIMGSIGKGLQLRDQFDQQRQKKLDLEKQNQIDQAYQAGMTTGPDGKVSFDQNKTLSALAGIKGAGKTAYDASNQFQTQDAAAKRAQLEKARQEIEMTGQLLGGVTDQATYAQAMKDAQRLGLPVDGMPPIYDPGLISNLQNRTLTAKDRIEQEWKKQDFGLREQELQSRAADRAEARSERRYLADLTRSEKKDAKIDKEVQALSKELSGVQEMTNAIDEVEQNLGFPLAAATTEGGKLKVNGKAADLPGVSVPLVGRVSAYSDKAQRLQSSAAKVFNTVLKDRSGAAVTNTELERLKTEFGEGKFNTEAQMVDALQRYKRALNKEMVNREAGFNPSAVQRYSEQGGRTSKSTAGTGDQTSQVRMIAPDGSIRLIPKTQVQAAISAGGKLAE